MRSKRAGSRFVDRLRPSSYGGGAFAASIADPRAWAHLARMVHFYNYSHVAQMRLVTVGGSPRIAPDVSFRNGERITLGSHVHLNAGCFLWAGDTSSRIIVGDHVLMAPDVFITASNYQFAPGEYIEDQPRTEADVVIGSDVWLGTRTIVVAGVEIGDGSIVGAGSIVTKSIPPGVIAAGSPARVIKDRDAAGSNPDGR